MPISHFQHGIQASPLIGADPLTIFAGMSESNVAQDGNIFFVDGDLGSDGNTGKAPNDATATIQAAINKAAAGAVIYVKARKIAAGGTDPISYAENLTIGPSLAGLSLIGVGSGVKQAAQPQIKKGSGSTAQLTIRAPGCLIFGLTINGTSATGGGILLDDDGTTKTAEGTIIDSCVFKGCVGSSATDGKSGGAVMIASGGGCWDTHIKNCLFFKNMGGVVLLGTSTVPQDVTIENCSFQGVAAADRDVDIWTHTGSGINNLVISKCLFGIFPSTNTNNLYFDLTGSTGLMTDCRFATTGKTFDADDGTGGLVPTGMLMVSCYQEGSVSGGGTVGLINRDSA